MVWTIEHCCRQQAHGPTKYWYLQIQDTPSPPRPTRTSTTIVTNFISSSITCKYPIPAIPSPLPSPISSARHTPHLDCLAATPLYQSTRLMRARSTGTKPESTEKFPPPPSPTATAAPSHTFCPTQSSIHIIIPSPARFSIQPLPLRPLSLSLATVSEGIGPDVFVFLLDRGHGALLIVDTYQSHPFCTLHTACAAPHLPSAIGIAAAAIGVPVSPQFGSRELE